MRHQACPLYRRGSIEIRGRAAGKQHLPWFKIPLKTMSRESIFISQWTWAVKTARNFLFFFKGGRYPQGTGHFQSYIFIFLFSFYQILYLTGTLGALLPWRRTVSNVRHGKFRKGMWLPWKQPHEWARASKEEKKKQKTFNKIETVWWHSLQSF